MKSTKRVFVVVLALALTVALAAIPASALTMEYVSDHGTIPGPEGGRDIEWGTSLSASQYSGATASISASHSSLVYAKVEAYLRNDKDEDKKVYHNVAHDLVTGTSASAFVNNIPQEDPSLGSLPIFFAQGNYAVNATATKQLEIYVQQAD